jgi:hypothetical protein
MNKIILVMGLMMLLLTSSVMAAEETNRFEKVKAWFINDDDNKTLNRTMEQERLQVEQTARYNAEMQATGELQARTNNSNIPEKAQLLMEQLRVGERVQVRQQEKLFGLFNVERTIAYEKTAIGPQRVSKIFDFMYRYAGE